MTVDDRISRTKQYELISIFKCKHPSWFLPDIRVMIIVSVSGLCNDRITGSVAKSLPPITLLQMDDTQPCIYNSVMQRVYFIFFLIRRETIYRLRCIPGHATIAGPWTCVKLHPQIKYIGCILKVQFVLIDVKYTVTGSVSCSISYSSVYYEIS